MQLLKGMRRLGLLLALTSQLPAIGAISFENGSFTLNEADASRDLKVRREDAGTPMTLNYRILFDGGEATADFQESLGQIDFSAEQTEASITLRPRRDGKVEGTEIFDLVVSETQGGLSLANGIIRLIDEQTAVGRDYSFTPMKDTVFVGELPDGSIAFRVVRYPISNPSVTKRMMPNGQWLEGWESADWNQYVNNAYIYTDGSMLLAPAIQSSGWPYSRLNPDGSVDSAWQIPVSIILGFHSGGRIIGGTAGGPARYYISQAVDTSFGPPNGTSQWIDAGAVLADGSIVSVPRAETNQHIEIYSPNGFRTGLSHRIPEVGPIVPLKKGGFAAVVFEKDAPNAAVGLGIFDALGNRKSFAKISGLDTMVKFGDGLALYGSYDEPVRYRGKENQVLFVNADGTINTSIVANYRSPVIARPGGKLFVQEPAAGYYGAYSQYRLTNAVISEIDFAEPEIAVYEGTTVKARVRRFGDTSQAATAIVQVKSGSAPGFPRTLRFEPLESEKIVEVPTTGNSLPEMDLQFELALAELTGATAGEHTTASVRVMDDDGRPGAVENGGANRWQIDPSMIQQDTNDFNSVDIRAMTTAPDGHVYVLARKGSGAIISFDRNGTIDRSFARHEFSAAFALATQSDGKILIAGELRSFSGRGVNSIARFTPAGEFDATFGSGGSVPGYTAHAIYALGVQPDDKIIIGGLLTQYNTRQNFLRLLKEGTIDPAFTAPPDFGYFALRIAVQPDGKILLAYPGYTPTGPNSGVSETWIDRLNPTGSFDASFGRQRAKDVFSSRLGALTLQPDGKILLGFGPELRRLTSSGDADTEFRLNGAPDGDVSEIINLPGGKILVAGLFKHIGGFERRGLARLNADGSVDTTFDPGVGANILHAVSLQNGDYLVGGEFKSYNGLPIQNLALIRASVTPRFALSATPQGETWFTANPGTKVSIDRSSDLINWESVDSRTLENFSTTITSDRSAPAQFLRAKIE